jgi:hypothetical protein
MEAGLLARIAREVPAARTVKLEDPPTPFKTTRILKAAGETRVAILDEAGGEIDGFTAKQCRIVNGDFLDKKVQWQDGASDVSRLAGKPVRLRFDARGTKLFSFRFADA